MPLKKIIIALILVLVVTLAMAGYLFFYQNQKLSGTYNVSQESDLLGNPLFENQSATINGTILKKEGKILTVKNNQGALGQIEASENLAIYGKPTDNLSVTASTSLDNIEINKPVIITLGVKDGKYQAITIAYSIPVNTAVPPISNVATSSTKLAPTTPPQLTTPTKLPPAPGIP